LLVGSPPIGFLLSPIFFSRSFLADLFTAFSLFGLASIAFRWLPNRPPPLRSWRFPNVFSRGGSRDFDSCSSFPQRLRSAHSRYIFGRSVSSSSFCQFPLCRGCVFFFLSRSLAPPVPRSRIPPTPPPRLGSFAPFAHISPEVNMLCGVPIPPVKGSSPQIASVSSLLANTPCFRNPDLKRFFFRALDQFSRSVSVALVRRQFPRFFHWTSMDLSTRIAPFFLSLPALADATFLPLLRHLRHSGSVVSILLLLLLRY